MISRIITILATAVLGFLLTDVIHAGRLLLDTIKLRPGFEITVYADVPNARGMTLGERGTVFVGTRSKGDVYAVVDKDGDHRADGVYTIARGLDMPVGVAYRERALFVSSVNRILRLDDIETHLTNPPTPVVVTDRLPKETQHGWKYLAFGPDGKLYVAVGAPCNVCEPDARHALIARMNADGTGYEVVASGVRNSVGFDWDPKSRDLWFTDNGRDWLGDDQPPDELNHASGIGMHFGFPYCHGGTIRDPDHATRRCAEFTPPALTLGPHVAALGMRFYTGKMFPAQYANQIFIAEHGSWNRSKKLGYRITLASRDQDGRMQYSTFAEGWLQGEEAWGRPVDVVVMPDGALLVSDDLAGVIYRIAYREPK